MQATIATWKSHYTFTLQLWDSLEGQIQDKGQVKKHNGLSHDEDAAKAGAASSTL